MLQQMRGFAKSWIASIFLLVVVGSFTLWGVADVFRGGTDTNVVSMDPDPITYEIFQRDYQNVLRNESQRTGHQITTDEARKAGIGSAVAEQMINRAALDRVTERLGLAVSDADVAERVRKIEVFNGPLGTFDKPTFQRVLQERGYTEQEFIETMRGDMERSQLMSTLGSGTALPPGYAHALFAFAGELRAAQYVVFTAQSLPPLSPPSDQVLAAFIKAHPDRFSTPEYRSVAIAMIGTDDFAPTIHVTDDQLKKEYEIRKSTYVVPEKRDVQQISFPNEAAAKAARAKLDAGMDFTTVASLSGQTVDDRGTVSQDDLGPLGAAVFAVPEGGVTQPVKNFASWVLLKATKITPGKSTSFDEAKADLTKLVTDQIAQGKLVDVANTYQDKVGDGLEIADAAKASGMHLVRVPAIDARGLTPDGSKAPIPADPELLQQIFASDVGEPSDPVQTKSGHTFGVAVEGVTPPKLKSVDAARADATRAWTNEQNAKRMQARAAALAAQAQKEGNLDAVAKELGTPVLTGQALSRDKPPATFSASLLEKIFAAKPASVVYGPASNNGGYVIARVSGVQHQEISPLDQRYRGGMMELGRQVGEDIASTMAQAERAKMNVKINQKLLDRAVGGEGQ